MDRENAYEKGWQMSASQDVGVLSSNIGNNYVTDIKNAINRLEKDMNSLKPNLGVKQLKGFVAEVWHADTFNIDAALKGSNSKAYVVGSNKFGSVDIDTNFGGKYSLKYYANASKSASNQAKNVIQAYHEYCSKSLSKNPLSFEEYLEKNYISQDMSELLKAVYYGQGRIIPTDQLQDAIKYLEKEIAKESMKETANRAAVLQNYKETLQNLMDRIKDGKGVESKTLTLEESETIAKLCKEENFKPEDFGLDPADLVTSKYVINQAAKAGINAAILSSVLKLIPNVCRVLDQLINDGEINKDDLRKIGTDSIIGGIDGFMKGGIACALTICCKTGKFGYFMKCVDPNILGAITVLAYDTLINGIKVIAGKLTPKEMGDRFAEEAYISTYGVNMGIAGQMMIPIPGIGFMIGSMLGSIIGSTLYRTGDRWISAFSKNANSLVGYYANLMEIDLEAFIDDVEEYNQISNKLEECTEIVEMNEILLSSYDALKLELPWEGSFDDFMINRNNHLKYRDAF